MLPSSKLNKIIAWNFCSRKILLHREDWTTTALTFLGSFRGLCGSFVRTSLRERSTYLRMYSRGAYLTLFLFESGVSVCLRLLARYNQWGRGIVADWAPLSMAQSNVTRVMYVSKKWSPTTKMTTTTSNIDFVGRCTWLPHKSKWVQALDLGCRMHHYTLWYPNSRWRKTKLRWPHAEGF